MCRNRNFQCLENIYIFSRFEIILIIIFCGNYFGTVSLAGLANQTAGKIGGGRTVTDSARVSSVPTSREIENVFVAVRVRPFTAREKKRSAKLTISPVDSTRLLLRNPDDNDNVKSFTFDRLYWSHDGFTEAHNGLLVADPSQPNSRQYIDQQALYQHLAVPLINNAWKGYNVALFAYGQTGSGKSYTMIGNGANRGLVPRICEDIFNTIENRKDLNIKVEITLSMMELYSEVVRDLLDHNDSLSRSNRRGLKIREHPTKGFFAEGLQSFMITSNDEMQNKINQGITNRSISATAMNETSSRSHMIILITIKQRFTKNGHEETKTSTINLVDLAGSERLSDLARSGEKGPISADRFKESVAINQSLSCLGNCIHALAEKAMGKNVKVPYRESVLTRLLMHALGGNSKTAMIANISPADINYEDTLSTLRYADRAKQIQNFARVNTESTEKIIRELKEENEKLRRLLERETLGTADSVTTSAFYDETKLKLEEEIEAIMHENERKLTELRQSYEDRLIQERNLHSSFTDQEYIRAKVGNEKQFNPYLSNLNFDEQLMGKIIFILKPGLNTIGKDPSCSIQLHGPLIMDRHATINRTERNKIILERIDDDCKILLNGDPVVHKVNLTHNDRLLFGASALYVFKNPLLSPDVGDDQSAEITFEIAQEEIASKAGLEINSDDHSAEQALLNQELLELFPAVEEANAISEELEKMVKFEIVLVAPIFLGKIGRKPEPHVKVNNSNTGQEFEWSKDKFLDRLYLMREMYFNYEMGEEEWDLPFDQDPFMEDIETECLIGTAQLYLQPLAYKIEVKEQLAILNYSGQEIGIMNIEAMPANNEGMEYSEHDDIFVDSPHEMFGKPLILSIKIVGCRGLPPKFTDIYVRYRMFVDEKYTVSEKISTPINPDMNFRQLFHYEQVTQQLLEYLKDGILNIEVWGRQMLRSSLTNGEGSVEKFVKNNGPKHTLQEELAKHGQELMKGFKMNGRVIDPNKQSIIVELLLMKKEQARMHQRIDNIKRLIDIAERQRRRFIPVHILKELIFATTSESADPILTQLLNDEAYVLRDLNNSAACNIS